MAQYDSAIARRARESLGERIRRRRRELDLTQVDLAHAANMNQGYISSIERDLRQPSPRALRALAVALDLPEAVLIGAGQEHDNPQPLETRLLPLLGSIPAGPPAQSQEQLEMFPVLRHLCRPDHYCLRLSYDSMEPTLKPGDIVLVHYRPAVNPVHVQGRICACLIGGEPTVKRVSVEQRNDQRLVILRGDNPTIAPAVVHPEQDLSIQGVVVKLVSRDL